MFYDFAEWIVITIQTEFFLANQTGFSIAKEIYEKVFKKAQPT
jgi:hypothetical protein